MKITIEAEVKEIAALIKNITQERPLGSDVDQIAKELHSFMSKTFDKTE